MITVDRSGSPQGLWVTEKGWNTSQKSGSPTRCCKVSPPLKNVLLVTNQLLHIHLHFTYFYFLHLHFNHTIKSASSIADKSHYKICLWA